MIWGKTSHEKWTELERQYQADKKGRWTYIWFPSWLSDGRCIWLQKAYERYEYDSIFGGGWKYYEKEPN